MPAPLAPAPRLRTVLCTRGGLYGARVLERLRRCEAIELCAIVRSERIVEARFGFLRGALALIRRSGLRYPLYLWCATTLADWLGRGASARQVPAFRTRDINSAEGLAFLARLSPDLLVSAFFDQRLKAAALALPALGCVNIHPSLLPDFRGVDPVVQARLAHGGSLGVTVHWMTAGLDEGAVLAQRAVAVPPAMSVFAATAALFSEGAGLLVGSLDRIARRDSGAAQSSPGSYQSWPTRGQLRALRARGVPLIRGSDLVGLLRAAGLRHAAGASASR